MSIIVSEKTRSLVIPRTGATTNMFPDMPSLVYRGQDHLVVPHDIRSSMLLNRMGERVPNPMVRYYDWKGGKPFSVQKATCTLLTGHTRAYVLNDMGTGKTKAALWAWDYLHGNGFAKKLLVVGPLSTLNFVWAREAFATVPHRKCVVLHGTKQQRLDKLKEDADIYVINHDGLRVIREELEARIDIDTLVLDELAVYRNNTDRSKIMRKFAERFIWVWGMTGAPMPNEPTDVWGQCMIVTPNTVPKYRRHCEQMLMKRISTYVLLPKPDAVDNAFKMMQPSVRYSLDDVVELPEVIQRTIDIDLTPQQKKVYGVLAREFKIMIANKSITAVNAAAAMNKLLQVSLGWVYTGKPFEAIALDNKPRMDVILDLIDSASRKVLLFVPFRHAVDGISKLLTGKDPTKPLVPHYVVHGGISNRDEIFNLFQNTSKGKVLLAHPQCLAHGVTLTAADTIIWGAPMASLEIYEQANARIRRVGQTHKQLIFHLQSTPVERRIYSLLRNKQKVQDEFLALLEEATGSAT